MILRPYQIDMVQAVEESPHRRVLVEAMTGLGKTVVFTELARRHLAHADGVARVLVVVHRAELAEQACRTISSMTGEVVGVEMGSQSCLGEMWLPRIIVASVQSLVAGGGRRLGRLADTPPTLVIVDECHHAAASSWRRVIDSFPDARVVGVTATADRADKVGLGEIFGGVAYRYDAYSAIEDGWLVPLRATSVRVTGLSYEGVRTTAGDLNGADLERVLNAERVPQGFAAGLCRFVEQSHKVLAFCPSVAAAAKVAEICNRRMSGVAGIVTGDTPESERSETIARFRAGDIRVLVNCAVLTEGFDCPDATAVALCGATKSRTRYVQMIGRGLRPLAGVVDGILDASERRAAIAASGKPHCLIIDFVGDSGRHSLMGPIDILGGRVPVEVSRRARRIIEDEGDEIDVDAAIERARLEEEQAIARRASLVAKVQLSIRRPMDPRSMSGVALPAPARWEQPASERQAAMLERIGVDVRGLTRRQANTLISEVVRRSRLGLCTLRQQRLLRDLGHSTDPLPTRAEASDLISDAIGSRRRSGT